MRVYKFGGASVATADGIRNVSRIIGQALQKEGATLFVVVSAMGKTTNALEEVLEAFGRYDNATAERLLKEIEQFHHRVIDELFDPEDVAAPTGPSKQDFSSSHAVQSPQLPSASPAISGSGHSAERMRAEASIVRERLAELFSSVRLLLQGSESRSDYDYWYDQLVGYGELLSSVILSRYLAAVGLSNNWLDMRGCFVTDGRYREANIQIDRSAQLLRKQVQEATGQLFVAQGFIGATPSGTTTTLGREGSDYSAAMAAYLLSAESLTIWKDVEGVLNADPHRFEQVVHVPQLTYLDAVELAYSGAQVIHPKTIKPLQNGEIPLYVKSFLVPQHPGSLICGAIDHPINVPMLILKRQQVLVSIRPKDFSFVLEDSLADIFRIFSQYRQRINLIQSSAVNLSLCIDDSHYLQRVIDILQADFRVVYNRALELLTIRGYDASTYDTYANGSGVLLVQKTRRTARIVRRSGEAIK